MTESKGDLIFFEHRHPCLQRGKALAANFNED
jgi:hypothetical protein